MATSYTETPDRSKETPFTHNYNADGSQNTADPLSVFYKSPGSTSPGETPTRYTQDDGSDPIASAYERMAQPPDDRESIRAQALRDVQAQLDAQTAFYAKQREVEQRRLAKAAELSSNRVNALGLQRGLSGSSVVEGEKSQDANLSAQEEAASMSQLNAQEANAKAGITGAATSAADEQYAAQVAAAQAAKLKQLDYLASLKPKERAPITVSAGQSVIDPETGEVIYTSSPADEGKSYILAPGQTIVDGSGKILYTAPQKEEAAKTYTVGAGQAIVDAQGNVIYQSKPEDTGKTYTLNPGQKVVDGTGKVIAENPPSANDVKTITVSPGSTVIDSTGKVLFTAPESASDSKPVTVGKDQVLVDPKTGKVIYKRDTSDISTADLNPEDKQFALKLAQDFDDASKGFVTQAAAKSRIDAVTQQPSAAGDIALIFSFMKLLDPTSVVREGEFATAATAGGVPDRVWAQYNKLLNGERLNENIRTDFIAQSNNIYQSAKAQQDKVNALYTDRANQYGVPVSLVVRNLDAISALQTAGSAENAAAVGEAIRDYSPQEVIDSLRGKPGATGTMLDVSRALGVTDEEYVRQATALGKDPAKVWEWLKSRAGGAYGPKA